MAQATRTAARSPVYTDDRLENINTWFQVNAKPIGLVVGGLAIVTLAVLVFRASEGSKREKASVALYAAQTPLSEGKFAEARTELAKVVQRYGGTSAGQQAALMLTQVYYEEGKYAEGIAALEKARGSASREFQAPMDALLAAGHESAGHADKAAEFYGKAAGEAQSDAEKQQFQASQARALMVAGKLDDAKKVWMELAANENGSFTQEARIRLGEIAGAGVK